MSSVGSCSPASRKRPASPAGASCGRSDGAEAAGGVSGSPRVKRRLFAAGGGGALLAWPGRRTAASTDEMDRVKLHQRRLIVLGAAMTVLASSMCILLVMRRRRGKRYYAKHLAPLLEALVELSSTIQAATAPIKPHPDLYPL